MPIIKAILYQLAKPFAKNLSIVGYALAILLAINNLSVSAQTQPSREYQLKAAFLFNFTRFVEWPKSSLPTDDVPLVIGILGSNPFGYFLEEIVAGEKVNGHPVVIHQYKSTEEIKACHILFINISETKKQEQAISDLKTRNILIVSDDKYFLDNGGMIRLFTKNNKIKIEVNLEASKAANLIISAKLLRLAEIYISKRKN